MDDIEVDIDTSDNNPSESSTSNAKQEPSPQKHKFVRLPLARIKHIMKKDPECANISQDAVFLLTKATELFIEFMCKETSKQLVIKKKKTMMRKDVDYVIETVPHLCFLDGALENV